MSEKVDELFGGEREVAAPRRGLAVAFLVSGLLVAALGARITSIPGGILVLLGWLVVQRDRDRVASGYLPADQLAGLRAVESWFMVGLLAIIALEAYQLYLFGWGARG